MNSYVLLDVKWFHCFIYLELISYFKLKLHTTEFIKLNTSSGCIQYVFVCFMESVLSIFPMWNACYDSIVRYLRGMKINAYTLFASSKYDLWSIYEIVLKKKKSGTKIKFSQFGWVVRMLSGSKFHISILYWNFRIFVHFVFCWVKNASCGKLCSVMLICDLKKKIKI